LTTRKVWLAGVIRDESTRLFDEFISRRVVSSVAATGLFSRTVQNVLNRQVDVVAGAQTRNLDAVSKTGERSVSPARAAVLGSVLIQAVGQVGNSIDVGPIKFVGEIRRRNVHVRQRCRVTVVDCIRADL